MKYHPSGKSNSQTSHDAERVGRKRGWWTLQGPGAGAQGRPGAKYCGGAVSDVLTGRGMDCQTEMNNESKGWPPMTHYRDAW